MTEIRVAVESDLDGVVRVGHETWKATYTPIAGADYVREGLARWWTRESTLPAILDGRVLVAVAEGEVVGMATYSISDDVATLWKLYVLPSQHGRGVGGGLMDAVVAAVSDRVGTLRLSHMAGNEVARAFYLRRGFLDTGEVKHDPDLGGPDDIWMSLPLA